MSGKVTQRIAGTVRSVMNRKLAIVPAYNEEEAIGTTIGSIHRWAPDFDVLVIDDGSTDRTSEQAAAAGARVLRMPYNLGIGGAMQSGYHLRQRRTATKWPSRSTAMGSTTPGRSRACSSALRRTPA